MVCKVLMRRNSKGKRKIPSLNPPTLCCCFSTSVSGRMFRDGEIRVHRNVRRPYAKAPQTARLELSRSSAQLTNKRQFIFIKINPTATGVKKDWSVGVGSGYVNKSTSINFMSQVWASEKRIITWMANHPLRSDTSLTFFLSHTSMM